MISDFKETGFSHIQGDKNATYSTSERVWITKIKKLKAKRPNDVIIRKENSDGSIFVEFPAKWLRIVPDRIISAEAREASKVRLQKMRLDKKK